MARTQRRQPPPPPSRPLAGSPPTPIKLPGWGAILDTITAEELDSDAGEVILLPQEYEERSEVEPEAYWRNQDDASRCWTSTFIYQHIQPHPRLARFIRPDEWTGLPVLAKPDGPPLETFIKSHKSSMYGMVSNSSPATATVRIQDTHKPLIYQWALQLADALARVHSYGKAETPSIWIAFGDVDMSKCWLTAGLNIQLVGFLNAACRIPGEPMHFGSRTNGSAFHPLEGKRGEHDSPTEQTDVFMWGCLVHELMTGAWPDDSVPYPEVITTGQWPRLESEYLGEVISNCWTGEIADGASLVDRLRSTISGLGWQVNEDMLVGFDAEALIAQS
ncbi:hypothetical protein BDZ85DRAFT_197618 [Elsinoe ampelina]|uniref:Protein kinase domain-containing protein n=1 Tax=Elsinoe ampelina TaxID=302913 RepID=A0A6A6GDT7_9PEZI|nr:hypothetical protein BDZ85DRAFT_197618 [Elsinoe ampelina]